MDQNLDLQVDFRFEIQACFCLLSVHTNIFQRDSAFWMPPLFEVVQGGIPVGSWDNAELNPPIMVCLKLSPF